MNLHNQEVRRLANCGRTSDSYAKHFAKLCPEKPATVKHIRSLMKVEVLWEGNPLSVNKTFGKLECLLCMKERILILQQHYTDKSRLINESNEFYGSCRHRAKFHRLTTTDLLKSTIPCTCTDEAVPAENGKAGRARKAGKLTVFV